MTASDTFISNYLAVLAFFLFHVNNQKVFFLIKNEEYDYNL